MRDSVDEKGVGSDVEGETEGDVGGALVDYGGEALRRGRRGGGGEWGGGVDVELDEEGTGRKSHFVDVYEAGESV